LQKWRCKGTELFTNNHLFEPISSGTIDPAVVVAVVVDVVAIECVLPSLAAAAANAAAAARRNYSSIRSYRDAIAAALVTTKCLGQQQR
jgi:hypothetical protein